MKQTLYISNIQHGLETNVTPFLINNDAFPVINNMYIYRGRIQKKRGTSLLGRLQRQLTTISAGTYTTANGTNMLAIFTGLGINTSEPTASIIPGNVSNITIAFGAPISQSLTDIAGTGTMTVVGAGSISSATINYSTGVLTITGTAVTGPAAVTVTLSYYPTLPVMGLEDFVQPPASAAAGGTNFPILVAFDTKYSYQFTQGNGPFYDVTFYKSSSVPFTWNGQNYQQFWSTNYQGAMWVTNANPGLHFLSASYTSGSGTPNITMNLKNGVSNFTTLVDGDVLYFNEWGGGGVTINGLSGTVTNATGAASGNYVITFTGNQTVSSTGLAFMLTNGLPGQDGIRWYDGDPIASSNVKGWVNFSPPLSVYNSVTNPHPYYLVGAKIIIPFKDRLIFMATYIQQSNGNAQYIQNQALYSHDGTAYYSNPTPANQTFDITAYYQVSGAGEGGFINAPIPYEIISTAENKDLLIVQFENQPLKFISTGDDVLPFVFQTISPELGAESTFSGVALDVGFVTIGPYGLTMATSESNQRIDLPILDQIFDITSTNNGDQRVTAIRDFRNELIYFTYPSNETSAWLFPTKTLVFNYRNNTWAIFIENFTHYGTFRRSSSLTWATVGLTFPTWASWDQPWNFGSISRKYPILIGGNQQGFVLQRNMDTLYEDNSQFIQGITISGTTITITSPNHCLNDGDYIEISGCLGVTNINGLIFLISTDETNTSDRNIFNLVLSTEQFPNPPTGTYIGGGVYRRLSNIQLQSKQFPVAWDQSRKARIGTQRYLFSTTDKGQLEAQIFVGQDSSNAASDPLVSSYPEFTDIIITTKEPDTIYPGSPSQVWHRSSNSFNGDSVQFGFMMNDAQMRDNNINSSDITLHAIAIDLYPGPILA